MNKTALTIIIVLAVVIGGYFLLRGKYQAPTPTPTSITTPRNQTGQPTTPAKEITVTGTEFSFNPSSISVKAGEKIKITFQNNGKTIHNLTLDKLGVGTKTVNPGKTDVVEFTAPSSGTYSFFCSISGHRASGMEGSLKVE